MNCQDCGAKISRYATCTNCGLVNDDDPVQEDVYEQNTRLRECLERLASRHVKSKPLWWQQLARDALAQKEAQ